MGESGCGIGFRSWYDGGLEAYCRAVGERIGKNHMTYGQGMSAELVAMTTIAAADGFGMPVSTTHVLNSAVAGTMVANKSGLNFATVRTILSAWIFTLPATICLSGGLFWLFLQFV